MAIFAGPEPAGLAGPISRFPEIRVVRTVENGLYLAALALWVLLALALFQSLRRTRPASALFGSALNIFGLAVLAAGAIPHVVTSRLSDLYHADGVRPDDQRRRWVVRSCALRALRRLGFAPFGRCAVWVLRRSACAFGLNETTPGRRAQLQAVTSAFPLKAARRGRPSALSGCSGRSSTASR